MNLGFAEGDSLVHRLDPRVRIVAGALFAALVAVSDRPTALVAALAVSMLAAALARLGPRKLAWHLASVNGFLLLLWLILPFATPGRAVWSFGPLAATHEGLLHALTITLKTNSIVLACTALLATMDVVRLGHALHHLGVPAKLVHVFLFTVRYFDLLHDEYHRLVAAMKCRGFRPRADRRTYRAYGHLVGMLLVRSFDRSERVLAAMKCRGFCGRFYVLRHFEFGRRDAAFVVAAALALGILGTLQWVATDL